MFLILQNVLKQMGILSGEATFWHPFFMGINSLIHLYLVASSLLINLMSPVHSLGVPSVFLAHLNVVQE